MEPTKEPSPAAGATSETAAAASPIAPAAPTIESAPNESANESAPKLGDAPQLVTEAVAEASAAPAVAVTSLPSSPTVSEPSTASPAPAETAAAPATDTAPAPSAAPPVAAPIPFAPRAGGRVRAANPSAAKSAAAPRGRFGLLAACVALAACLGAAGGAASVAGVGKLTAQAPVTAKAVAPARSETADEVKALRDQVAQMRTALRAVSDTVGTLRSGQDSGNKAAQAQFARLAEALDRLEKAQAEPQARIAKLTEAVERLERRTAQSAHPAPQQHAAAAPAAPETTGSVKPPRLPPLNPDARTAKPVIEGWTVRRVYEGVALVQNKQYGSFEVEVGDDILGAGQVQDIKRQDGKWVVVTSRGTIMPATPASLPPPR
ncbi:MAG: hypothetical protein IT538_08590 [Variibacter sp.]|nr:hypothetical protein [Variibacter sp.]